MDTKQFGFDPVRQEKREALIQGGTDPYPYGFDDPTPVAEVHARWDREETDGQDPAFRVTVAGRVWAQRRMGKTMFLDLRDRTGKIQLQVRRDDYEEKVWAELKQLDLGDLIGCDGEVFRTRMGERTIRAENATLLAKTLVPIPIGKETDEKTYNRVTDVETKYRERYLHWLVDTEDRERIALRSKILAAFRRGIEGIGFLEVDTPTIEFVYGGAEARPFRTSIWALGHRDAFLRISPELYLKRYLVAGFDKVYTICKNFRNEGIDRSHNPEFTMMEWYEAYTDYHVQMVRFENLVAGVCRDVLGTTTVEYQGTTLEFAPPWKRITVLDALKEAGVDASAMSAQDLHGEMRKHDLAIEGDCPWGIAVMALFEHLCEATLIQPTIVCDHPIEISPLTKLKRGDTRLVERFEPYAWGMEIGNAYSELTDPVEQIARLEGQRRRNQGEDFANHPIDPDFVRAMGCGMPPAGGVGLGIDRIIMLLTNATTIRDIIPFPMIKPHGSPGSELSDEG